MKENKNLRVNRKNRNCLFNREAAMRIQGFRGNCDPQASWGCAPALPNQIQVVFLGELLLGIPIFSVRQKGVLPLLLPASVLQLPRCLVRICNLFHKGKQTANWQVSKSAIAAGKTDCKIEFSSQMWAARPHLGSIFEKLLHRKTFYLPAARSQHPTVLSPYITKKPP